MEVIKPTQTILDRHLLDNEKADVEQLKADLDYMAMMLGIDLHEDEEVKDEQEL